MGSEAKTLDVCMIVKNELKNLGLTLGNMVSCADRVIVVDTGSTDDTKKFCIDSGADVHDFVWQKDFAAARNYSISKSDADWIIWLDADEHIEKEDFSKLRQHLQDCEADVLFVDINECEFGKKSAFTRYKRDKIFRNRIGIHFERRINEQLVCEGKKLKYEQFKEFRIFHWGAHLPNDMHIKKIKSRISEFSDVFNSTKDPYIGFIIGGLYGSISDDAAAHRIYDEILTMAKKDREALSLLHHAVCVRKAWLYKKCNDHSNAIVYADRAINLDPSFIEPYVLKSSCLISLKKYAETIDFLQRALLLTKKNHPVLGVADFMWDFKLYQDLANSYLFLEDYEKAEMYYKKILENNDDKNIGLIVSKLEQMKLLK